MLFNWFDARQATEVGNSLAEHFTQPSAPRPGKRAQKAQTKEQHVLLEKFARRVQTEARPLNLNMYKRAKLAHAFKWKLLQQGVEAEVVDELTRMLLLELAARRTSP